MEVVFVALILLSGLAVAVAAGFGLFALARDEPRNQPLNKPQKNMR